MSYVRWSSVVRKDCHVCGASGYVPDPKGWRGRSLCRACTSCWYIFSNANGKLSVWHSGACLGGCPEDIRDVPWPDAAKWQPPAGCPMGDVALDRVREAIRRKEEAGEDA